MKMLKNMKLVTRLGLGFGLLLVFLAVIVVTSITRLKDLNDATDRIVRLDWVKAELAMKIDSTARANARRTLELFVAADKNHEATVKERMGVNIKFITESLEKLDGLIYLPEGKAWMMKIRESRAAYVASFTKVAQFLEDNKRDEATRLLLVETLPRLDILQENILGLVELQKKLVETSAEAAQQGYEQARNLMFILSALSLGVGLLAAVLLTKSILKQIGGEPDYAADIVSKIAGGNLFLQVKTGDKDDSSLLFAMKMMVARLSQVVRDVNGGADALASASEEVSATAQSLSQAASEQAAGVEETSASLEEMTASIAQNTENAKVTESMATKAAQEASEGGEAVNETVAAMKQIAKKIGIIDDIAYQTNLLALNAAIEAARAGENGKGFAVVAAEVRKLAERSQVAAQEIGEVASNSVELAEKAGRLLHSMVPSIRKTSDLVQEISASSTEQSSGVGQINAAVAQLNQTTQQNASSSEELAATAEEMSSQAEQLQQTISFFKLESSDRVRIKDPRRAAFKPTAAKRGEEHAAIHSEEAISEAQFTKY
jgi:methyl-accepting chemotaxis protein